MIFSQNQRDTGINSQNKEAGLTVKRAVRYAMMPEILPRIRALGFHFGHFAYLLALVFGSARLIPQAHPVMNPANIGRFGVRQVIAIAAANVRWTWKNTDQIAIFLAVVSGLVLIVVQAAIIAAYAVLGTAHASATNPGSFFETPAANVPTDVILIFLEQVFGPNLGVFGAASQPLGTPVYEGLQKVLGLYSMATMVIAVIIVLYYILTVIGEAAKTGTPFGQRFNSLWAPIRLVIALGLLVPLGSSTGAGLNSAQYITLWLAKMGSGLGTTIWTQFATTFTEANDIVTKPASESTSALVSRIFLSEVCAAAYNRIEQNNGYQIKILQALNGTSIAPNFSNPQSMVTAAKDAGMAFVVLSWSANEVGERANDYSCGHITIDLADFDFFSDTGYTQQRDDTFWEWIWGGRDLSNKIGTVHSDVRAAYIQEIKAISDAVKPAAEAVAEFSVSINPGAGLGNRATLDAANIPGVLQGAAESAYTNINTVIETTYTTLTNSSFAKSGAYEEIVKRGWGAAGLWYGNLTKINQKYMDAISAAAPTLGTIIGAPQIRNAGQDQNRGFFEAIFGTSRSMSGDAIKELDSAVLIAEQNYAEFIYQSTPKDSPLYTEARFSSAHAGSTSGIAYALLWMLGGDDLYDLKNNPTLDPMGRLAATGHGMLTRSFALFGAASAAAVVGASAGKIPGAVKKLAAEAVGALAGLLFTLAGIGLIAGVFLAYIIPLMPFIYFSFAVIAWILEIFEAVIAMPLWALSHLQIAGDGMPGPTALGGYQLLLMILLRPALIVFGLIGGYVIFGAAMYFFITLFNSATTITQQDIAGNDIGAFGIFIYTLVFAFLAYNIAIMCFKMIDDVPKGILRWMGAGVQTFGDSRSDPIGGSREVLVGAVGAGALLKQGAGQATQGLSKAKERYMERRTGLDPDTKPQNVRIVGDERGAPPAGGGSGGPIGPDSGPRGGPSPIGGQGSGRFGTTWSADPSKNGNDDKK